jgi:probable F420-dependent oxidoreductase
VQFGFFLPDLVDPSLPQRFGPTYEICRLAESVGFDFVAMGHHRFTPETADPASPIVLLSAIAAQTSRLRLSSAVFLFPLYPVLDVAEQLATLDQVSDGRTMLSFGLGYRPYEYEHAGLSYRARAARMEEGVQILRQAWTQDRVHFAGKHYRIDGAAVTPRPVQQPHPPIWLGGNAMAGIERAARLADGWMIDSTKSLESARRRTAHYRSTAANLGRDSQVCLVRQVGIGPTRAYVKEVWLPDMARQLLHVYEAGGSFTGGEELARKVRSGEPFDLDEFTADRDIAGTPEECVTQIRAFEDATGCEYFCGIFADSPDVDTLAASLELFGRDVIPRFASKLSGLAAREQQNS